MTEILTVPFSSLEHRATLALRQTVMRDPSDPAFTDEEVEAEREDVHPRR